MGIFNSTDKVASIQKKASDCLSVFSKTVTDLATLNVEIESEVETREEQINALQEEKATLKLTKANNDKLIKKIEDFFYT